MDKSALVINLRKTMKRRDLSYERLSQLTGIPKHSLEKLVGDTSFQMSQEVLDDLADQLLVDRKWFQTGEGDAPSWAANLPACLEINPVYEGWLSALKTAWQRYIHLERDAVTGPSVRRMLEPSQQGQSPCAWSRYHRSIVFEPLSSAFNAHQLCRLSFELRIPDTPSIEMVLQRRKESQERSRIMGCSTPSDPSLSDLFSGPWEDLKINDGFCYEKLMGRLRKIKDLILKDENPHKTKGRPRNIPKVAPRPHLDAVLAAMDKAFAHKFPDDQDLSLDDAVKHFRDHRKGRFIPPETMFGPQFDGYEGLCRMQIGELRHEQDLIMESKDFGIPKEQVMSEIKRLYPSGNAEVKIFKRRGAYWAFRTDDDFPGSHEALVIKHIERLGRLGRGRSSDAQSWDLPKS